MGREAVCLCDWAGNAVEVKAVLEGGEIVLRGALRKRVPFSEIKNVKAEAGRLRFTAAGDCVDLHLGAAAEKWAAAITTPPPSLAHKLGMTDKTIVRVIGQVCDEALNEAIAQSAGISNQDTSLMVACVDSPDSLDAALRAAKPQLLKGVPLWMVYAKGPGHAIDETAIRTLLRENGLIDTKVASVSAKYTALRFIHRKAE
jgi:hypothetical protein